MNHTLLGGFYRVECRRTKLENVALIQADLDRFLEYDNLHRSHYGYRPLGETPSRPSS